MALKYEDVMKVGAGIWALSMAGILHADFIPDDYKLLAAGGVTALEMLMFIPFVCIGDDDEYEPARS